MSHLFFADDILLFAEAGIDQVECIKMGLHKFCSSSGQKINFNKSSIYFSPNISDQVAKSLSSIIGIPRTSELGCYLGHQVVHKGWNERAQTLLIDKVRKRLEGWKSKCLSRAGRVTLAKSVLNSMGKFQMQFQRLPSRVHRKLDKNVRQCVWGEIDGRRKIHLVAWDVLCRAKEQGYVGLKRAEAMNKSLIVKLAWRLLNHEDERWAQIIRLKYGITDDGPIMFKPKQRSSNDLP